MNEVTKELQILYVYKKPASQMSKRTLPQCLSYFISLINIAHVQNIVKL